MGFFAFYIVGVVISLLVTAGLNDLAKNHKLSGAFSLASWLFLLVVAGAFLSETQPTLKRKKDDKQI